MVTKVPEQQEAKKADSEVSDEFRIGREIFLRNNGAASTFTVRRTGQYK
jgi:hypothetical protein